jgi:hypothetical protein
LLAGLDLSRRLSLRRFNTQPEVERFLKTLPDAVATLTSVDVPRGFRAQAMHLPAFLAKVWRSAGTLPAVAGACLIEIEAAFARRGAIKKPDRICSPAPFRVAALMASV